MGRHGKFSIKEKGTEEIPINQMILGDLFKRYGFVYQVCGELKTIKDERTGMTCYQRPCKLISEIRPHTTPHHVREYTLMSGTEKLTYSRIIN